MFTSIAGHFFWQGWLWFSAHALGANLRLTLFADSILLLHLKSVDISGSGLSAGLLPVVVALINFNGVDLFDRV